MIFVPVKVWGRTGGGSYWRWDCLLEHWMRGKKLYHEKLDKSHHYNENSKRKRTQIRFVVNGTGKTWLRDRNVPTWKEVPCDEFHQAIKSRNVWELATPWPQRPISNPQARSPQGSAGAGGAASSESSSWTYLRKTLKHRHGPRVWAMPLPPACCSCSCIIQLTLGVESPPLYSREVGSWHSVSL